MNLIHRLEHWGDLHHPKWLDIIRMVLGIFLCFKGYQYLQNSGTLTSLMTLRSPFSGLMIILLAHYVAFAHLIGGILMTVGVFTRFACAIQIPILVGAIIFVNSAEGIFRPYSELFLSVIVLLLLIYFMIIGNGPWALNIDTEEKKP
ncbi:DoxX family protein [Ferruginibacter albus]|uniref:DoxX family protein n=1 Tax=Ferruginibacter albus TaxID=2875540 RepID=UPI001CC34A91|nr:DoxX family protein [Ferruginibacter albus]UAY51062.1 DoxX family protein [Ferruginibacter albus]